MTTTLYTLKYPITPDATEIEVDQPVTELCATLATPSHVFLTLYTAGGNETVVATKCVGNKLVVVRGMDGTERKSWPAGACINVLRVVPGSICDDVESAAAGGLLTNCGALLGLTVCGGLTLARDDDCSARICMNPTGVVPGTYCGAEVNEFGQLTFIPTNWPMSCLPVFNPCGPCDGGSGDSNGDGVVDASDLAYSPPLGACVGHSDNVQGVLEQHETAICGLINANYGVLSVQAGTGLILTGPLSSPTISMVPTAITPGIYDGFTINQFGQITGYGAPPAAALPSFTGTLPVVVTATPGNFAFKVNDATASDKGVVTLANTGEVLAGTASTSTDQVPTYGAVDGAFVRKATQIKTEEGLTGGGPLMGDRTLKLDIGNLPPLSALQVDDNDSHVIYDVTTGKHYRVSNSDMTFATQGAWANGRFNATLNAMSSQRNIASALAVGNHVDITLVAMLTTQYVVTVTPMGAAPQAYSVQVLAPNIFRVHWASAVPDFMVAVYAGS